MENRVEHVHIKVVEIPDWMALSILAGFVLVGISLVWLLAWMFWPKRRDD
jgi:hypothetical protein